MINCSLSQHTWPPGTVHVCGMQPSLQSLVSHVLLELPRHPHSVVVGSSCKQLNQFLSKNTLQNTAAFVKQVLSPHPVGVQDLHTHIPFRVSSYCYNIICATTFVHSTYFDMKYVNTGITNEVHKVLFYLGAEPPDLS